MLKLRVSPSQSMTPGVHDLHRHFCTLFDGDYLFKGLALHESLCAHMDEFTLWILCMDDKAHSLLRKLDLDHVRLISLSEFEDEELLGVKCGRTRAEYCWTCTSSLLLYLLSHNDEMHSLTYLDADLFFFGSPSLAFDELGSGSVGIVAHRCAGQHARIEAVSGTYNVAFMIFRNDRIAAECLRWWRTRCLEWCYNRYEDGRYGDQKYLDEWPELFPNVVVLRHAGLGAAPWNVSDFEVRPGIGGGVLLGECELVYYHFHGLDVLAAGKEFRLAPARYRLHKSVVRWIYRPYTEALSRAIDRTPRPCAGGYTQTGITE